MLCSKYTEQNDKHSKIMRQSRSNSTSKFKVIAFIHEFMKNKFLYRKCPSELGFYLVYNKLFVS